MILMRRWVGLGVVAAGFGSGVLSSEELVYRLGHSCKKNRLPLVPVLEAVCNELGGSTEPLVELDDQQ
eukprot:12288029-Ditylum_brightwellii.AAC.1